MREFDLIVIGSGPSGEKGAAQAAYFGKRVAIVEKAPHPGGTTANTGTLPSKTLRETALSLTGYRQRGLYGFDLRLKERVTVADLLIRSEAVSNAERERVYRNLERHGIELIRGTATFVDRATLRVESAAGGEEMLTAPVILIATGSVPNRPSEYPFDGHVVLDSDDLMKLDFMPKRMAVLGAGVVGCEYASIFAALDVEVTLVDKRNELLGFLDQEISSALGRRLEQLGVRLRLGTNVQKVSVVDHTAHLVLEGGEVIETDHVLVAAGRQGGVEKLNLGAAGLEADRRGVIAVDANYRTKVEGIYAAGDVVGWPSLASVSMEQARLAICHAFHFDYKSSLAPVLPLGIYTVPEVSAAGETEVTAAEKGIPYEIGRSSFGTNARGLIIGETEGFLKLIFRTDDRTLLGVHVIGEGATELIHVGLTALQQRSKIDLFIDAVYNYPTMTEAYKYAAYDGLGRLARRRVFEEGGGAVTSG